MRKLGVVTSPAEGELEIEATPEAVDAFMAQHGSVYRLLRSLVIELVREGSRMDNAPRPDPELPPPSQLPLGPRSDSGIPYFDGRALAWRARRDDARRRGVRFEEAPPYRWEG